jgi:peptidoglycan biosynthesis protein MviN/MurJ (putative lipid II flippase)
MWQTRKFEKRGNIFFFAFTASGVLLTLTLLVVNVLGTFFSPETIDWIIAYHPGEIYSYIFANMYLWVCYFTNLRYFWPTETVHLYKKRMGCWY